MKSGNESEDWRTVRERPSGAMHMQDRLNGQCSIHKETAGIEVNVLHGLQPWPHLSSSCFQCLSQLCRPEEQISAASITRWTDDLPLTNTYLILLQT